MTPRVEDPRGGSDGGDEDQCASCAEDAEDAPHHECPESKFACGHHCNCSWTQDACCWCGWVAPDPEA